MLLEGLVPGFGTQHCRSPCDCQAWPCSAATGAGPALSHWICLPSHWPGGLDVSLSPSSAAQLRSSVVRGRKWVQLPGTSATSLPPARAQPGVTDGRWSRHSLLLVVLWFSIFFPVKKATKQKNQQKPPRKVEGRACSSLCAVARGCLHQCGSTSTDQNPPQNSGV